MRYLDRNAPLGKYHHIELMISLTNANTLFSSSIYTGMRTSLPPATANPWASESVVRSREPTSEGMRSRQASSGPQPAKRPDPGSLDIKANPWLATDAEPALQHVTTNGTSEQRHVDEVELAKSRDPLGALA